ncbi:MAG: KH domain-containing protein, partial [bacterium]
ETVVVFNIFKKNSNNQEAEVPDTTSMAGVSELLRFVVAKLVDHPDEVSIKEIAGDRNTVLEININEADMGKVIGKKGRIIKSLRIILRAAALNDGKNISVELMKSSEV